MGLKSSDPNSFTLETTVDTQAESVFNAEGLILRTEILLHSRPQPAREPNLCSDGHNDNVIHYD